VTAGRREWLGLAVIALPTLLVTMDLSVLFLAVPKLTRALHPSSSQLLWITDIYGFMIAGCLITMGTIGDRIGRRRLLMIGGATFAAASLLAAFAPSPAVLIGARALLGIAGATLAPSSLALIRNMFHDPLERQRAVSIWISCFAAGAAIGPILGGILLQGFWWGSVFLPNVPVMALLVATGPSLLPESRDPNPGRLDPASVLISLASLLALVYGVTRASEHGVGLLPVSFVAAGLLAGAGFLLRQRRISYPLVDVSLFRTPRFTAPFGAMLVSMVIIAGTDFFIAQYVQLVHGVSPLETGLWLLPGIVAIIVGSMTVPALTTRLTPGRILVASLVVAALGLLIMGQLAPGSHLLVLVAAMVLVGLGAGPIGAVGTDLLVSAAPAERAGSASAVSETATELGGALGIALLGSLGTAVYRHDLSRSLPNGISTHAAAEAKATLGGAAETAARIGGAVGTQLRVAAHTAFTHGLTSAALAAVALALMAAVAAALGLRVRATTDDEHKRRSATETNPPGVDRGEA
jgi:MFS transporter, DHA2 family, multidrug resistance protein